MVRRLSRVYWLLAILFLVGVLVQVFLAGLGTLGSTDSWDLHAGLGYGLFIPLIGMVTLMYPARLPRPLKIWTWALLGVYVIQANAVMLFRPSAISALHPVLALFIFVLAIRLIQQVNAHSAASGNQTHGT